MPGKKPFEAQKRSTAGTLSREMPHTRLGFSGERKKVLTTCAIRAPWYELIMIHGKLSMGN